MSEKKILGYRKFNSKKGEAFCIVIAMEPFSDRELEHGACGNKCEEIFIPKEYHEMINAQVIGKNLVPTYNVSGGRAYIVGLQIK